jgi:hypothetical protein
MRITRAELLRLMGTGVAVASLSELGALASSVPQSWAATSLVKGLFEEGTGTYPPSVTNVSCSAYWADLQPTKGGAIASNNVIDQFLASGKTGRVRVFFGRHSPTWAYNLAGAVSVYDPVDKVGASVPRWWTSAVISAQSEFVSKLAAKYDGRIPVVFIANGGTIYAEPFIRGIGSDYTRKNLLAAGYTPAADKSSYNAGLSMFSAFKTTRLAMAFNPWEYVNSMTDYGADVTFTIAMMDRMRTLFGSRAIWQNNSLQWPLLGHQYTTMYNHMSKQKPLSFQTDLASRVGSYSDALTWAVNQGAHAVELSPTFQNYLTASQLSKYDTLLRQQ